MKKGGAGKINPALEKAVTKLLEAVDSYVALKDKVSIITVGLKLEAIKTKIADDKWGADLDKIIEEEPEEEEEKA